MDDKLGKFGKILLVVLVLSFILQSPALFLNVGAKGASAVNYPLALRFSIKLDATSNQWFVNVTNIGSETLFLIFSLSPGPFSSWTAENHTTISPGMKFAMVTHCYDPYNRVPCTLAKNKAYNLVYNAWSAVSSDSLSLSSNLSASNHVFIFNSYPFIALKLTTSVNAQKWNVTVSNTGTKVGRFQAFLSYIGLNNQNGYQVGTTFQRLASSESFQLMNRLFSPKTYSGAAAFVDAYGYYSGGTGTGGWSATLHVEKILTVG